MVFGDINLDNSYWEALEIRSNDIDFLYSYLLEKETPLTSHNLAQALILERIRVESENLKKKQQKNGEIYLPKLDINPSDKVQFPALNWISGEVTEVRPGNNPELPDFDVITVALDDGGIRQFAAKLEDHLLNVVSTQTDPDDQNIEDTIIEEFGEAITSKLEIKLEENQELVRIGEEWFPKSLLIDFNVGHLNLAEAVLDMHEGGPLPADELLKQIDIETDDPKKLVGFSLNYALKEDERFDEVGISGNVQWFLNRLEPEYVREWPLELAFSADTYDRSTLTEDMLKSEQLIDDELVEFNPDYQRKVSSKETSVTLNYPHWRVGSIPLTAYTRQFFPTALESPRVKFKIIDLKGNEISAWVVRPYNYIYGLRKWYEEVELMPGSILKIKPGKEPGEVIIYPQKKRSNREWIKTLLIGADGGVVFANLKQTITADYNERMAIMIPATEALDALWKKRSNNPRPLKNVVIDTMKELAKLNPQGHVHGAELYAALNCIKRCPPGLIYYVLASNLEFDAVGDLYFRLSNNS